MSDAVRNNTGIHWTFPYLPSILLSESYSLLAFIFRPNSWP